MKERLCKEGLPAQDRRWRCKALGTIKDLRKAIPRYCGLENPQLPIESRVFGLKPQKCPVKF